MPSYHTIAAGEKSSLLGSEFVRQHPELAGSPVVVEHYLDGGHCSCDRKQAYTRRRSGCCAWLCRLMFWTVVATVAFVYFVKQTHPQLQLPNFWNLGSPVDVPVGVAACPAASISYKPGELSYSFDVAADGNPDRFYFGQHWVRKPKAGPAARFIQTGGEVIVQAAPADAADAVSVDFEVKLSHNELADAINIKKDSAGVVLETHTFLDGFTGADPCISIIATISVAPSANVSSFDIDTVVLPVHLKRSLQLISSNLFIHSTAGEITSETTHLNVRKIEVETTSKPITGSFPLADLLSVKSVSGMVQLDIEPRGNALEESAGTLLIRTDTGSIQAQTATSVLPDRKFISQVHTVSGSVSGTFLLGVTSNVNSASGSIEADFYTVGTLTNRSCTVTSVSGGIRSGVLDNLYKLGTVRSHFQSQIGGVDVHLPSAWVGHIQADTKTGSVDITGEGVQIIKDISPVPGYGRYVIAEKGVGDNNLSMKSLSGAISAKFN